MNGTKSPVVLILTSSFGEGHNSAAKGMAAALDRSCRTVIEDTCALGQPVLNAFCKWGYKLVITKFPLLWKWMFSIADKTDMSKDPLLFVSSSKKALAYELEKLCPDLILSPYPLYPYLLDDIFRKTGKRIPYYIVVTDSLVINRSWLCSQPDGWFVTDEETKRRMAARGVEADKITVTGFPVSPVLESYPHMPLDGWKPGDAPNVLYFANRDSRHTERDLNAIMAALPNVALTIVLGRNVRTLFRTVERLKRSHLDKVKIIGWTRRVPELLSKAHLVIGKAGGATVHEVLAAQCPMLVNHVVYGQEEGNVELLEFLGAGRLVRTPEAMTSTLREIFADHDPLWPRMKENAIKAKMSGGAAKIADLVLHTLGKRDN